MAIRPIMFSGPMILALRFGKKTATSRLETSPLAKSEVGDQLWVREPLIIDDTGVRYAADDTKIWVPPTAKPMWEGRLPPMFMPRWASRLVLVVTDKAFRPVQSMLGEEFAAEGIFREEAGWTWPGHDQHYAKARLAFADLWDGLHAKPGRHWVDNPRVVALNFSVEKRNIGL